VSPTEPPVFFSGLDLGQLADSSALCVMERSEQTDDNGRLVRYYTVRHLQRWPLRTRYVDIVADIVKLFSRPPLSSSVLCVDRTGVGVAVFEQLARARPKARLVPITITGGATTSCGEDGCWSVPKRELAGVIGILLGSHRLKISPSPLAKELAKELATFKVKVNINTGNESFEAWRSRDHDDCVLATALSAWYSERAAKQFWVR
jgi:hypothetical protein